MTDVFVEDAVLAGRCPRSPQRQVTLSLGPVRTTARWPTLAPVLTVWRGPMKMTSRISGT